MFLYEEKQENQIIRISWVLQLYVLPEHPFLFDLPNVVVLVDLGLAIVLLPSGFGYFVSTHQTHFFIHFSEKLSDHLFLFLLFVLFKLLLLLLGLSEISELLLAFQQLVWVK